MCAGGKISFGDGCFWHEESIKNRFKEEKLYLRLENRGDRGDPIQQRLHHFVAQTWGVPEAIGVAVGSHRPVE